MKLKQLWSITRRFIVEYTPEILTGAGVSGFITTVVMACKATPKAEKRLTLLQQKIGEEFPERLEEERIEDGNRISIVKLTPFEVFKATIPEYWPAATVGIFTIAFFIFATTVNSKRRAALLAAYELSENTVRGYQKLVKEKYGEEEDRQMREEIYRERNNLLPVESNVILSPKDDFKCRDEIGGAMFMSSPEKLQRAANNVNAQLLKNGYACVNDLYDELGLRHTDSGYKLGWSYSDSKDGLLELVLTPGYDSDTGELYLLVGYNYDPTYDFRDY